MIIPSAGEIEWVSLDISAFFSDKIPSICYTHRNKVYRMMIPPLLFWTMSATLLLASGVLLVLWLRARAVQQHKKQEQDVRQLFLDAVLHDTIDSIYLKDSQHRILLGSDQFYTNLKRPLDQVLGHTDVDFFGQEFGERTMRREKEILQSGVPESGLVEQRIDEAGDLVYSLTTKVPVHHNGKVVGLFGITSEFNEIARLQEELTHSATHDPLTGLLNRTAITAKLRQALRNHQPVAVLFVDMDDFKQFNDEYGHGFGDELLKQAARRMERALRKDDLIGRLGGDEFIVVLNSVVSRTDAEAAVKKLCRQFERPFEAMEHSVVCCFSVGIACTIACPVADSLSAEDLIRCADRAMYQVKNSGKGGYGFFEGVCGE
jgi:diguanylate cyclase (GGDEF)-like protein